MNVELRPLGVKCNIQCRYCYQNPERDAGNVLQSYDMQRMKDAVEQIGGGFTLFGGEPLMVREQDLEALWAWGFEEYGKNGVQTNGTLINDNHIRMFKAYQVHVGISVDGPGELNDARWSGTRSRTRADTEKTLAAIERLCREGVAMSLIVTLHRCNAMPDKLPIMHDWLRHLDDLGLSSARLHILEVESEAIRAEYALSDEQNAAAFLSFMELEKELQNIRFDAFDDMRSMLLGQDQKTTCIWNSCDPYTTRAVQGVEGNGQRSNCGRTNKEGIEFVKSDTEGFERYLALYQTPQQFGGCKGCRFFLMCKGQCPGTAIDGDWRNRTEHCQVWMTLYDHLEKELLDDDRVPVSVRPDREKIEAEFLASWARGKNTYMANVISRMEQAEPHGNSTDGAELGGHGDEHGDFTDFGRRR